MLGYGVLRALLPMLSRLEGNVSYSLALAHGEYYLGIYYTDRSGARMIMTAFGSFGQIAEGVKMVLEDVEW